MFCLPSPCCSAPAAPCPPAKASSIPAAPRSSDSASATLQDLGFVIDKASLDLGSVTGTKLKGYTVRMTVNVMPRGKNQMTVRAGAQYNVTPIEDPVIYQDFFNALSKSLFLQAHLED